MLGYAGLDPVKADGFAFLAAHGKHRVEAHHVMNASALRAYLWAFVLALWQQVWVRSGVDASRESLGMIRRSPAPIQAMSRILAARSSRI